MAARQPMVFVHAVRCALVVLALLVVPACATLDEPLRLHLGSPAAEIRECASWFHEVDSAVRLAGVGDASAHRISGFPYLRVDRFLASFREDVARSNDAFQAWVARLRELDRGARRAELQNLPPRLLNELGGGGVERAWQRTEECALRLQRVDLSSPEQRAMLAARGRVPDDYAAWQRALGLYALVRIPFAAGVASWQEDVVATIGRVRSGAASAHRVIRYVPPQTPLLPRDVAAVFSEARTDALGIPQFRPEQVATLIAAYAPVFEVETTGDYDRVGALAWRGGAAPQVDITRPMVYHRLAYTRYREKTLVQIVYTVWFPERPHDHPLDLFAGRLDGLMWRVTLTRDGEAAVFDTIHPCGCFHMFFPTPRVAVLPQPDTDEEWNFVPATLPQPPANARALVRIATRTHYVSDVSRDSRAEGLAYEFVDENALRSLAAEGGTRKSAYGPDGLIEGTERPERWLFWPMGVPSAGAMRQWGRHATAFIGRRHFDDAHLIERRFRILGYR